MKAFFLTAPFALAALAATAAPVIDGSFTDWADIPAIQDATGDQVANGIDFLELKHHVAERELLIYLKVGAPIDWRAARINFYFDADGDAASGLPLGSMGADYTWDFSSLFGSGDYFGGGPSASLGKGAFLSAGAPIEPSAEFEFAIPFSHMSKGSGNPTTVRFLFRANGTGDLLPDSGGFIEVAIPRHQQPRRIKNNWDKFHPQDVRIISWNVYQDGPYAPEKDAGAFGRQLQALKPDIIHFQELYAASPTWVRNFLQQWIPAPEGKFWFTAKQNDCITASLFPILRSWSVDNNLFVEINMQSVWGTNAIMLNAHTPAFNDGEPGRISETTNFLNWIRQARTDGILTPTTPLLLVGDFNTGSYTPELIAMRTGIYPDGSNRRAELVSGFGELTDLAPVQLDNNLIYTWRSGPSSGRSRLDYIFYPANQLWAVQSFVLAPESLSAASVQRIGLLTSDYYVADHKITGGDFRLQASVIPGTPVPHTPDYIHDGYSLIFRFYEPWYYGFGFGWVYTNRSMYDPDTGFFWLWHQDHGWMASMSSIWPWAWSYQSSSWVLLAGI